MFMPYHHPQAQAEWSMGVKAESRCRLGKQIVNRLRHSYLNEMKLENYGPIGECLKNNH
jgi:hypothetical protein